MWPTNHFRRRMDSTFPTFREFGKRPNRRGMRCPAEHTAPLSSIFAGALNNSSRRRRWLRHVDEHAGERLRMIAIRERAIMEIDQRTNASLISGRPTIQHHRTSASPSFGPYRNRRAKTGDTIRASPQDFTLNHNNSSCLEPSVSPTIAREARQRMIITSSPVPHPKVIETFPRTAVSMLNLSLTDRLCKFRGRHLGHRMRKAGQFIWNVAGISPSTAVIRECAGVDCRSTMFGPRGAVASCSWPTGSAPAWDLTHMRGGAS
jgi:hypothetical protein